MLNDFLIVGCGLSGAVLAERIANKLKKKVLIIDKRNHIGGNCYDYIDKETNIRVNSFYKGRYLRACAPVLEQAPSSWSRPRGAEGNHLRNGVKSCFADGDVRRAHPHVHPLPAFATHRP